MCLELSRIAHNLSPSCHTLEDTLVFDSADGIESFQSEFSQRGPKRKQILLWQCCQCGQGGNPIRSEPDQEQYTQLGALHLKVEGGAPFGCTSK
ncbi:hypothetical protein CGGC5_v009792 [Colletotrichum fructicola Nara gc5]|uniref:Uncharacterized protein n=1 Tax=Colletotrichum fructicola (strain Nara gc5) TaxID=1213859 RepID=A0A7J6IX65_COLFN|nr:hypothetical protein CGGC5_v009792 [Colletotrichum fructicola Nara gc5]